MILAAKQKISKIGLFSVVWIIITSGTVLFNNENVVRYTLVFDVILVVFQLIPYRKVLFSNYGKRFVLFGFMIFLVIFSVIANLDFASLLTYARIFLVIALALGASLYLSNEAIAEIFVKVIVIMAGISVFLFYFEFVENNASIFPVIAFGEHSYVNAFVYIFINGISIHRNFGIFIEPGLYQVYINIALFILLHSVKRYRYKYMAVIILLVANYSTQSTTGYILSALIIISQIFSSKQRKKGIIYQFITVVAVLLIMWFVVTSDFFSDNIEDKFTGGGQNSYESRKNASIIDFLIILQNPLTGAGAGMYKSLLDSYDNTGLTIDASANTFSQMGAIIGVPIVLVILWRVIIYVSCLNIGLFGKWALFVVYIISFSTEPFVLYPIFYLPIFMSYNFKKIH